MQIDSLSTNNIKFGIPTKIVLFIGTILCFEPGLFDKHPMMLVFDQLYNYGVVLISVVLGVIYLKKKHGLINRVLVLVLVFGCISFVSTFLADGEIKSWVFDIATIILAFLIVSISLEDGFKYTISLFFYVLSSIGIINFVSIIMFPHGIIQVAIEGKYTLQGVWFIGSENQIPPLLIVLVTFALIRLINNWGFKIVNVLIVVMCLFEIYYSTSATGQIGICLLLLLSLMYMLRGWFKNSHLPHILCVCVMALFILLVIVGSFDFLHVIIVNLFNKNMTLTTRTIIWEKAIDAIVSKPILGYGRCSNDMNRLVFGHTHCHNEYLNIAYYYGLAGLFFWLCLLGKAVDTASNIWHIKEVPVLFFCLFAYMIMFISEVFGNNYLSGFYVVLFLVVLVGYHLRDNKEGNYD